jgi:hypothetical protein
MDKLFPEVPGQVVTVFVPPKRGSGLPIALILMDIEMWVIIENRGKYLPMVK